MIEYILLVWLLIGYAIAIHHLLKKISKEYRKNKDIIFKVFFVIPIVMWALVPLTIIAKLKHHSKQR